jgi:hypothetical protein
MPRTGAIDCQSHLYVPAVLNLLEQRSADPRLYRKGGDRYVQMGAWHRRVFAQHTDVDATVATMDANGIALTALSINDPGPEWFGEDAPRVAWMCNDFIADTVRRHPTRFIGLGVLPLLQIEAALVELDRCINELGMRGILLYTNLAGQFPDEPQFRPLFARAVELDIPILLHPAKAVTIDAVQAYEMTSTLGNMFEDTIALTRLIMSGSSTNTGISSSSARTSAAPCPLLSAGLIIRPRYCGAGPPCSVNPASTCVRCGLTSCHPYPRPSVSRTTCSGLNDCFSPATIRGSSRTSSWMHFVVCDCHRRMRQPFCMATPVDSSDCRR